MLLKINSSLRKTTKKKIKNNHRELHFSRWSVFSWYFAYLSQRDKWWLVLLHVIFLFFLFGMSRLDIFSLVTIEKKTAGILIDQRTSNVATIITLAVIGLLLSNLAIKDNQTYKLLFVNSKLYLILYYTLSVILCLMIISTLRDTIPQPIFQQFVLAGTFLASLILLGVGYLFRTIINFANASKIQSILTEELLLEAKANLRLNLLAKYSSESFIALMASHDIDIISRNITEHRKGIDLTIRRQGIKEKLIYDIDLQRLARILSKRKDKIQRYYYTQVLSLNLVTLEYTDYIWPNMIKLGGKPMNLSKCLTLKDNSKLIGHVDEYRSYFDKKLQEYSSEGKHTKVEEILSIYTDLFVLNMKHG